MPVASTAAGIEWSGLWLASMLGPTRSAGSPDSYIVHAWFDNPQGDSPSEVDFDGYEPATLDADDWDAPDGREVSTSGLVDLGTPASSSTDAARYWSLHRSSDDALLYSAPLESPLTVIYDPDNPPTNPVQIRLIVPFGGRN